MAFFPRSIGAQCGPRAECHSYTERKYGTQCSALAALTESRGDGIEALHGFRGAARGMSDPRVYSPKQRQTLLDAATTHQQEGPVPKPQADDKAKVKFVYLEVEGANSSLEQMVKTIAASVGRGPVAVVPSGPKTPMLPRATDVADHGQGNLFGDASSAVDVADELEEMPTKAQRVRTPRPAPAIPEIIPDLDVGSGEGSLDWYLGSKEPDSDLKKYLMIVAWLRDHRAVPAATVNHVATCYLQMKWTPPKDPTGPLRDLSKKRRQCLSGDGTGAYTLTAVGLREVAEMRKS
jgi:hypothetical protein